MERFARMATRSHISPMTYARFLLSETLPSELQRVLYVDSDILVLQDLEALCVADLGGACIGATLDTWLDPRIKANDPCCKEAPRVSDYFNAGVLLIDMDRWRTMQVEPRALDYLTENPQTPFSDQDALNVVLEHDWRALSERWNFQGHQEVNFSTMAPGKWPGIVHFVTAAKPWKTESASPNASFYNRFRDRTEFRRSPVAVVAEALRGRWLGAKRRLRRLLQ